MVERWWWKQKSTTEGYCKSLQFGGNVERIVGTTCSLMVSSGADIAHSYLVSSASFSSVIDRKGPTFVRRLIQLPTDWSDCGPTTYSVTDRPWSDDLLFYLLVGLIDESRDCIGREAKWHQLLVSCTYDDSGAVVCLSSYDRIQYYLPWWCCVIFSWSIISDVGDFERFDIEKKLHKHSMGIFEM